MLTPTSSERNNTVDGRGRDDTPAQYCAAGHRNTVTTAHLHDYRKLHAAISRTLKCVITGVKPTPKTSRYNHRTQAGGDRRRSPHNSHKASQSFLHPETPHSRCNHSISTPLRARYQHTITVLQWLRWCDHRNTTRHRDRSRSPRQPQHNDG